VRPTFRNWLAVRETHWFTDQHPDHYGNAEEDGKPMVSMASFVDLAYDVVAHRQFPPWRTPNHGAVAWDGWVVQENSRDGTWRMPVKVVVYPTEVLKGNLGKGQAHGVRGQMKLFWDPDTQTGMDRYGKAYDLRLLKNVISHELVHLTDPAVQDRNRAWMADPMHQGYFDDPENVAAFQNDTEVDYDPPSGKPPDEAEYRAYISTPRERKAFRGGSAWELADRLYHGGTADPGDELGDRPAGEAEAMGRLRGATRDALVNPAKWRQMTRQKDINRTMSDTWKYLYRRYRGEKPSPAPAAWTPNTIADLAAQRRAARQQVTPPG
jgi:hypothetical protein